MRKKRGELKLENLQRKKYARSTHDQSHNSHARCARSDPRAPPWDLGNVISALCPDDRPKPAHAQAQVHFTNATHVKISGSLSELCD